MKERIRNVLMRGLTPESSRIVAILPHLIGLFFALVPICGLAQTPTTAPASLEEIQKLLNVAHKQLKAKQSVARDVVFFSGGMPKDKSGYCERFWHALKTQDSFDIPRPAMLAAEPSDKEKLFEFLHNSAKSNFERYLSQDGKLFPDKYMDAEGKTLGLAPSPRKKSSDPKYLPQKFANVWQRGADNHGFFEANNILDQSLSTHILYMQPYPVPGYVRPLLITFVKDRCDKCMGISMGVGVVSVDGLSQPDLMQVQYFSQTSYVEAEVEAGKRNISRPVGPYLLMGMGVFNGKQIFWTLKRQTWVDSPMNEELGYFKAGDSKAYFRNYAIDVLPLDNPRYQGPGTACSVEFN